MDAFNEELNNAISSAMFDSPLMFVIGSAKNIIDFAINLSDVKKSEK